jgi:UDP-2,4-diacetamido-2,4,6-trideoxy-beta-L-altropyranose hydrolase
LKNRLLIRVEGSVETGMGHLVRCLSLAGMVFDLFEITFVGRSLFPESILQNIKANAFSFKQIKSEEDFFEILNSGDIVLLDGYTFESEYQKKVKSIGCKLVCIDDLHDKVMYADLVINHVPGVSVKDYRAANYTRFALGTDYALLRSTFLKSDDSERASKVIKTLLICFGGSDPLNLTMSALNTALKFTEFEKILVISGPGYSFKDELVQFISGKDRIKHYHDLSEEEMYSVLRSADLAIVPASGILMEVLTFKIPVITGIYIQNQTIFLREFSKYRQVFNADSFTDASLTASIEKVLASDINADRIIDKQSGKRIRKLFESLLNTVYLITGTNRGLGEALINNILKKDRSFVVAIARSVTDEQRQYIKSNKLIHISQDLTEELQIEQIKNAFNNFPSESNIVFINNASVIGPIATLDEMDAESIRNSVAVNITSPLMIFHFLVNHFFNRNIDFVNITSGAANLSIPHWSLYASSKAYLNRFFASMAVDYSAMLNFRFKSIDPGLIDTAMQKEIRSSNSPERTYFENAKAEGKLNTADFAAKRVLNQISVQ